MKKILFAVALAASTLSAVAPASAADYNRDHHPVMKRHHHPVCHNVRHHGHIVRQCR